MSLAVIIGGCAFVILGIMVALLWLSDRHDGEDPITQEIIIKANTGPVDITTSVVNINPTQEKQD